MKIRAIVTGASRGIGYAVSEELLRRGFQCLLTAKDASGLQSAAGKLAGSTKTDVLQIPLNLADEGSVSKLKEFADAHDFRPDALILNAGTFFENSLTEGPIEELTQTLRINLVANVEIIKAFLAELSASDFPRVVLIGSTAALEPYSFGPYYGISKWGVRGLACNARHELKEAGIGVTLINPGGTLTDLWAGEDLPSDRLLLPSDIAKAVGLIFDLSSQAVVEELIVRPMLGDMH